MRFLAHIRSNRHPEWTLCELPWRKQIAADDDSDPCELCFELAKDDPDTNTLSRILRERGLRSLKKRRGRLVMK